MSRRVKIDDFGKALQEILNDYGNNVTSKVHAAVIKAAEVAKQETKAGAPVRTGAYKKGWAVRDTSGRLVTEAIIYNRSRYQIAHLLEHGHAKQNGGRVAGIPHIQPAEENAIKNMEKAVKEIAKES